MVKRMPEQFLNGDSKEITQWYIGINPPVRVKLENFHNCYLTIEIKKEPGVNYKLEDDIPASALSALAGARRFHIIRKTRYNVKNLELDVFHAELEGLALLGFKRKYKGEIFEIPIEFLVEEVTADERFDNHNLAMLDRIPEEWGCEITKETPV